MTAEGQGRGGDGELGLCRGEARGTGTISQVLGRGQEGFTDPRRAQVSTGGKRTSSGVSRVLSTFDLSCGLGATESPSGPS